MVSLIVAMDTHGLIGKNGGLPWHCPADMIQFRQRTMHHSILMGRITYEHIKIPLMDRFVHVATRSLISPKETTYVVCHDVEALLRQFKQIDDILYVCGGASIYEQAFAYVDDVWISYIEGDYTGDTWFPTPSWELKEVMKRQEEGFLLVHYIVHK